MKKLTITTWVLLAGIIAGGTASAQSLVDEKKIELTKDQRKNEMEGALRDNETGGVLVYFEAKKADKVKGEKKRKYERFETVLDQDLNTVSGDYITMGTKHAVRPKIFYDDKRIGYTTWVDEEGKTDMKMVQLVQFDKKNKIQKVQDIEVCAEKEFKDYRIVDMGGDLILMVQYESKQKETKNLDFVRYFRIDANSLEIEAQNDLNLLGRNAFGLEYLMAQDGKIYMVGKELAIIKPFKIMTVKNYLLFRLNLDGQEEARKVLELPNGLRMAGAQLHINQDDLMLAGEYALGGTKVKKPIAPYGNRSGLVSNPYIGIFVMRLNKTDFSQKVVNVYDYQKDVLKKLRKGNPGFTKKKGSFALNDFVFLPDGSFYLTAEMFTKTWITQKQTTQAGNMSYTTYYYYTDFTYLDAVVYKFNANCEMDWLVQIDRDMYTRRYNGHLTSEKPIEPGKLDAFLQDDHKLAVLYNTPGKKYGKKRFGLSEILIAADGNSGDPIDFTSQAQFGLLDGGIISVDRNTIIAVGTDKKEDYLWVKKIKLN